VRDPAAAGGEPQVLIFDPVVDQDVAGLAVLALRFRGPGQNIYLVAEMLAHPTDLVGDRARNA
jgi:hypothetical protein